MKYMMHSIASTTWVALKRSRILPPGQSFWFGANRIRAISCSARDHLARRRRIRLAALLEQRHRRRHAAGAMRHAGQRQSHLDAGQRAQERQLVALAEMADAKHFSGELAQAGAERHVVIVEHGFAELVGVVPG